MKIAMLAPIAWRTPPVHYGPWELVTSLLTEELVRNGVEVTLFATGNSVTTAGLESVIDQGYEENRNVDAKVWECLHISNCMERAGEFDIIHNQFDFLPLSYSGLIDTPVVTTIHGFSSPRILPVYQKYNGQTHYVSISNADRAPSLDYISTVYHGIDPDEFTFNNNPKGDYLLYYGRIHHDKGAREAVEIAIKLGMRLIMAGIIQDKPYFDKHIEPYLKEGEVEYIGSIGRDRRNKLLGNATALLHPINFSEPFGLSVVEAMTCGTPVVAFDKGSMREIITDGVDGFIVNNKDEMIQKLKSIEKIDRTACRRKVETRFTRQQMAQEYMKVYNKILNMGS